MIDLIQNNQDELVAACKSHYVESISIFGSAAKNTMNESSDVDFLVCFSDDLDVLDYADNYFSLLEKLKSILGRKVDLVSVRSIKNPVLKKSINESKIDLYAA